MLDEVSRSLVRRALAEDMGGYGDVTSAWTVPEGLRGRAEIVAREGLVLCGLPLAEAVMEAVDRDCAFVGVAEEGSSVDEIGGDYPTRDGTGVRDYIDVNDLAAGHLAALDYVAAHGHPRVQPWHGRWNVGPRNGRCVSGSQRTKDPVRGGAPTSRRCRRVLCRCQSGAAVGLVGSADGRRHGCFLVALAI